MRNLAIAVLATLALALPAGATEDQAYAIDAIGQAVIDGTADADELYAIATDPATSPACVKYADALHAGFKLIDLTEEYPDSWSVGVLFDFVLEALPTFRNDCLLAI